MPRNTRKVSVERIEYLRKEAGYTIVEVADKIGLWSKNGKSYYDIKKKGSTSEETLIKLANLYGVRREYIEGKDDYRTLEEYLEKEKTDLNARVNYLNQLGYMVNPWVISEHKMGYMVSRFEEPPQEGFIGKQRKWIVTKEGLEALVNTMDKVVDTLLLTSMESMQSELWKEL